MKQSYQIYREKPKDIEKRLTKEIRVYDLLEALHIPYERVDHAPAFTMEDCVGIRDELGICDCKNLFLTNASKTQFYMLMLPGEKKLKTKILSKEIGSSRLSFAPEEKMYEYLEITPGSVSVMGLMNDKDNHVSLLMDEELLQWEYIGCHPCVNTSSIKLKTKHLIESFLPAVSHTYQAVCLRDLESEM